MIDVRSDTVTRPTPGMLEAMMHAHVGDDVFGEDETVNELQRTTAERFGMEAALFCPSGTMTNQIGIKVHTQPGDEVICDELSHVYLYEGGGIAFNSGASTRLMKGHRGRFTARDVLDNVNRDDDSHFPHTRLVSIENTVNKGGGCCWELAEIEQIRKACDARGLALHLDGARLFNALVARSEDPRRYGELFDTISVCLSKGLGAPAGSLLLGPKALIEKAHRYRKVMGGGMRQAGYIAAAGKYALEHHVERLREDHAKASAVAAELAKCSYVASVLPAETNIVIFTLADGVDTQRFLKHLKDSDVHALSVGRQLIRFVFHLDVSAAQVEALIGSLRKFHPA
jgi:threonine aldolase